MWLRVPSHCKDFWGWVWLCDLAAKPENCTDLSFLLVSFCLKTGENRTTLNHLCWHSFQETLNFFPHQCSIPKYDRSSLPYPTTRGRESSDFSALSSLHYTTVDTNTTPLFSPHPNHCFLLFPSNNNRTAAIYRSKPLKWVLPDFAQRESS